MRVLREVVQEAGVNHTSDYFCYFDDGAPACIIGHALFKLGVPAAALARGNFDGFGKGAFLRMIR